MATTDTGMLTKWYSDYMAKPPSAETYTATQAGTTNWNVDNDQTVQHRIKGVIAEDGALMQQAGTRAAQQSAKRGLLNSSLGVQAGQSALYDAAMPIATQDASTYARAGEFNADSANRASIANAGFSNDAARFNAGEKNTAMGQWRDAGIGGEDRAWRSGERVAGQDWQSGESGKDRAWRSGESDKAMKFETSERESLFAQTLQRDTTLFDDRLKEISAQTEAQLKVIDGQNGTNLARDYRLQTQASYDTFIATSTRIQESDMDPDVKQAQLAELQALFSSRQDYINTIFGLTPGWNEEWAQFGLEFGPPGG